MSSKLRTLLCQRLEAEELPLHLIRAIPNLPNGIEGALLYGSRARRDAQDGSDVDLLMLSEIPHPTINRGAVSVSFYSAKQLETGVGTLFGAHLRRDGKVLIDTSGTLSRLVNQMGEVDVDRLFGRALAMSTPFTTLQFDLPHYLPGLAREARYLLRSCLYAQSIADGEPSFSVRALAARYGDPDLAVLLSSRPSHPPSEADLSNCITKLKSLLGNFPKNKHGSLEATVVNEWGSHSDLLSMAFMALGATGNEQDDYAEVEKILL